MSVDDIEEEIIKAIMEEMGIQGGNDDSGEEKPERGGEEAGKSAKKAQNSKKPKKRKKKAFRRVALIIIIAAIAVCAYLFFYEEEQRKSSVDYILEQAETAVDQKNYERAAAYLEQVMVIDPENAEAYYLYGRAYMMAGDSESAEECFCKSIEIDSGNADPYTELLDIYYSRGDYDEIKKLRDSVKDAKILAVIDEYIIDEPQISLEGGEYDEYLTISLSTDQKLTEIYYTLDGSEPDAGSILYEEEIFIGEQGKTVLKAVCYNTKRGDYSRVVSATYMITLPVPEEPEATPDGGMFSSPQSISVYVPEGTEVYYTWGSADPTENSAKYTGPISMPEGNNVLSLIAIDEYGMKSGVVRCNYIYYSADY